MAVQILDPTTEVSNRSINYAARPESLAGLRIGLIDNTKHNSDQLLLRIADILENREEISVSILSRLDELKAELERQDRHLLSEMLG